MISNLDLSEYCIRNNRFTCGSNESYDKLFIANENNVGIDVLAGIIYANSEAGGFEDYQIIKDDLSTLLRRNEIINARKQLPEINRYDVVVDVNILGIDEATEKVEDLQEKIKSAKMIAKEIANLVENLEVFIKN